MRGSGMNLGWKGGRRAQEKRGREKGMRGLPCSRNRTYDSTPWREKGDLTGRGLRSLGSRLKSQQGKRIRSCKDFGLRLEPVGGGIDKKDWICPEGKLVRGKGEKKAQKMLKGNQRSRGEGVEGGPCRDERLNSGKSRGWALYAKRLRKKSSGATRPSGKRRQWRKGALRC